MNAALFGLAAFSLVAFTALGLLQRWPIRLSVIYAVTMTAFVGIVGVLAHVAIGAVGA